MQKDTEEHFFLSHKANNKQHRCIVIERGEVRVTNKRDQKGPLNPYPTAFPYGNGMVLHF